MSKLFSLIFMIFAACSMCEVYAQEIPRHLYNARILQENTLPADTSYRHSDRIVKWKGEYGATKYECHTDCSGLIDALLEYSYGFTKEGLHVWLGGRERPLARNYYNAFVEGNRFQHIVNISQIQPGDFIAMKYLPGHSDKGHDTGHIMVVNAIPREVVSYPEYGTVIKRWGVEIIDCSGGHGRGDTRYREGRLWPGIGKGNFSIFSNEQGMIIGYTWSLSNDSKFYGPDKRPLAVGRYLQN